MKNFSPKFAVIHVLISVAVAALISYLSNSSFLICFLLVEFGMLANGFIMGLGKKDR